MRLKPQSHHSINRVLVVCVGDVLSLALGGQLISNNTVLSLDSLGDANGNTSFPLFCITNEPSCCNISQAGNWFPPSGDIPVDDSDNSTGLYQSWSDDQSVQLLRPAGADVVESGLYRCQIPDRENNTQVFFVGIYSNETGGESVTIVTTASCK